MSFELQEANLGHFLNFKNGKSSPDRSDDSAYPVFGSNGIIGRSEKTNCTANTIVIGRVGSYCGSVHFSEEKCWVSDNAISCTTKKFGEELFWFYFLERLNLNQFSSGSGQPLLNQATLNSVECIVPADSDVRIDIGNILRSFDRKISLNTQTNQTLEAMAQAIFKSWFVDFDPVKAKMNGEQPQGMDEATASLFPDKLVESELGLIPEGWSVCTLSNLVDLIGGGTPKRSEKAYWGGEIPWFSVKDVPSGSDVFVVDTDEKITELGLSKSSTKLLKKGTTIITARGTVGKLALVGTDMCMNQSCYGIRGKEVGDYYNYFNLNEAVSTLQQNTHGAVFDTITTKTFDTYSMAFSGVELANRFDEIIAPLLQKIESNVRQNIELSALRNTLLPKLLSGEIELSNAEDLVEVSA
ncbi:restriction endonuclease subunit S [Shewanella sp. A32]|uniref:restriction endonuclease subunit S n=1 Tax=Shewanella sp. A32 TaxID=3031327 RepID=UPI0023B9DE7C|nr:restriction endonuclease subunit S [Shewanella sp. A32]MDF0534689.1 restriction endonuclease subunit S [Shewanella sp. A32]